MDATKRRKKIRECLREVGASVFLVQDLDTIRYLTGFSGSDAVLLVAGEEAAGDVFLCDSRYTAQAQQEVHQCTIREYRKKLDGIRDALESMKVRDMALEAHVATLAFFDKIRESLPEVRLVPVHQNMSVVRVLKDASELTMIREAIRVASESFREVQWRIAVGVKEREVAVELEYAMRRRGAQRVSFDTIVASGERSALPHGAAGERRFGTGDLVIADFGAVVNGYNSDETCTLVVGKRSQEQERVHGIVLEAQKRAIHAIRPGMELAKIDAIARDFIREAGYGAYFGHGLGHGVGINVHEEPRLAPDIEGFTEEGMVFTVEPGIYIPGWGGIRLEDMVLVTSDGCEKLTYLPKTLISC
jgi:Xaa-Pro aminopeptidase